MFVVENKTGCRIVVVRKAGGLVVRVRFPAARPIKTSQIFGGKSLLARPAFDGSRFAKTLLFGD